MSEPEVHSMSDVVLLQLEVARLEQEILKFTDDTCYGRCVSSDGMLAWFQHETRGLLDDEEAHQVLDMLLNKLTQDGWEGCAG